MKLIGMEEIAEFGYYSAGAAQMVAPPGTRAICIGGHSELDSCVVEASGGALPGARRLSVKRPLMVEMERGARLRVRPRIPILSAAGGGWASAEKLLAGLEVEFYGGHPAGALPLFRAPARYAVDYDLTGVSAIARQATLCTAGRKQIDLWAVNSGTDDVNMVITSIAPKTGDIWHGQGYAAEVQETQIYPTDGSELVLAAGGGTPFYADLGASIFDAKPQWISIWAYAPLAASAADALDVVIEVHD